MVFLLKFAWAKVDTLKEVLVSMPATAIMRHTQLYEQVYGKSLKDEAAGGFARKESK